MSATLEQKYYECELFWSNGMLEDAANQKRINTTIAMVPEYVRSLADIGCGNGVFIHELKRLRPYIQVMGVERSQSALNFVHTEKMLGDITEIPLPDRSFDCVSCLQVLEHIPYDKYETALEELARVSRKYLLVSVPYKENLENNVSQCPHCKTVFNNDLHVRSYDDDSIENMFSKYGYECIGKEFPITYPKYWGISWLKSLKPQLDRKKLDVFQSPLCPVCGYENEQFQTNASHAEGGTQVLQEALQPEAIRRKGLKETLKAMWPKKDVPGFWVVGLYAKQSM